MNESPIVFVGPRGGYQGLDRTLATSLLGRGRMLLEVDTHRVRRPRGEGLRTLVDDVADAVRRAALVSRVDQVGEVALPALVGYSIGAQVAAVFTAENPGAVSSLTLIAGWVESHEKMRDAGALWRALSSFDAAGSGEQLGLSVRSAQLVLASAREWPGAVSAARMQLAAAEIEGLMSLCDVADIVSVAEGITGPVLVIGCSSDEFATVQQSRRLFGAIPDARYAEIDCGHLACIERPAEVAARVESFLANPYRDPAGTRMSGYRP